MPDLTLAAAQQIISAALAHGRAKNMRPLGVAVLDARGALKAYAAEDRTSLRRFDIARGKAYGALALGVGSRTIGKMAVERPHFVAAVTHAVGGTLVPVAGGVLIKAQDGAVLGAVGVTGDSSDNDEAAAMAGIAAAGFVGDPGAD
jgi:uncharacterized protein GlcG (DUF336 family)